MKITIKVFLLLFLFTCYSCVTTSFLPTDDSVKYAPSESIKVFWKEPKESYIIIGRVSAEGEDVNEETLFKELKVKAMAVGAEAIIMGDTKQRSSVVGVPVYGGGTIIGETSSTRIIALAIRFTE